MATTVKVEKASDWSFEEYIQISTLEDLFELTKKYGHNIIIRARQPYETEDEERTIIVYDDYME